MDKIIRFITAYDTVIVKFDEDNNDQVIITQANPRRDVEKVVCSYTEAITTFRNRSDFKKALKFEILTQIEDNSSNGFHWEITEDLLV